MDWIRLQDNVVGAVDQDAWTVCVKGRPGGTVEPRSMTMTVRDVVAIDLGDRDVGISNLRIVEEARRSNEESPEDAAIKDVELIEFPLPSNFAESEEAIISSAVVAHVARLGQRDPERMDAVTGAIELVCQSALSRMVKG